MNYQQLLEVYFGKDQNKKEMQNCITELRKINRKNNATYDDTEKVYNRKMNESNNIFMDVFTSLDD